MQEKELCKDKPAFIEKASDIESPAGCSGCCCENESTIETGEINDLHDEMMEEIFFLIYNLHMSLTEAEAIPVFKRKWLISRFIEQKQYEKEVIEHMRRKQSSVISPDLLQEIERSRNA